MSNWYYRVINDLSQVPMFINYYENELAISKKELSLKGTSIEKHAGELPSIIETRYSQLQEIEAVLEYLNISLSKMRSSEFKKFLESYNRSLSSRDAEKYVDGVQSVVDMSLIINEVALVRNRYLGIMKGLDQKSFCISNIVKLRAAGLEDITI